MVSYIFSISFRNPAFDILHVGVFSVKFIVDQSVTFVITENVIYHVD